MDQYPTNYPQAPQQQAISQPMPTNDDPNKMQYYPQSPPPPQYTGPPAGTPMYYAQGQPMQINPYPPPQQQQQQSVVVFSPTPAPMIIQQTPIESYCGHQIFACFVLWCCNFLFGLIAWILALVADTQTKFSDRKAAQRLGKVSLGLSISGIIVTAIIVAIAVGVSVGGRSSSGCSISYNSYGYSSCQYTVNNVCYSSQRYVGSCSYYGCCSSSGDFYCNSYCYSKY